MMLITIATYSNATDAYIAKGLLESQGITCNLKNALTAQMLPFDVELQVEETDVDHSLEILNETDL